jgi:hypothetical protein
MKTFALTLPTLAAVLLFASIGAPIPASAQAQQPGRGGPGGPPLPAEQQAEVDRIVAALDAETKAVSVANSNLIAATFATPTNKEKITKANDELTRTRAAWAAKASKLFADNQASDKKLSQEAIARLIQISSGGRNFGPRGPSGTRRPPAQ